MTTEAGVFAKNVSLTLVGKIVPILITIISIPILLSELGVSRFGLLMIIMMFIGYFGLLDLGIPRAIIHFMAKNKNQSDFNLLDFIHTCFSVLVLISSVSGILIYLASPMLMIDVLKMDVEFVDEAILSLRIIAITLPILILSGVYRGILESVQDFRILNLYQIIFGSLNYGLPILVVWVEPTLTGVVVAMLATRIVNTYFLFKSSKGHITGLDVQFKIVQSMIQPLFRYTGWLSLSNILIPILSYADRFLIAFVLTLDDVTYYSTPMEITTRFGLITFSLVIVAFPTLSQAHVDNREKAMRMYQMMMKSLMIVGFFISINVILLSETLIRIWLGQPFVEPMVDILRILMIALFVNTLAQTPSTYLQSAGRPDIVAKINMALIASTILILYVLIQYVGTEGAAWARLLYHVFDAVLLYYFCKTAFKLNPLERFLLPTGVSLGLLIAAHYFDIGFIGWLVSIPVQIGLAYISYRYILTVQERSVIHGLYTTYVNR